MSNLVHADGTLLSQEEMDKLVKDPWTFDCIKCGKKLDETFLGITLVNHNKTISTMPDKVDICRLCIQYLLADLMCGDFSIFSVVKRLFTKGK